MDIEQTGLVEDHSDGTGCNQSNGAGHHKPSDGFGGNTTKGGSLADLADCHHNGTENHGDNNELKGADKKLAANIE